MSDEEKTEQETTKEDESKVESGLRDELQKAKSAEQAITQKLNMSLRRAHALEAILKGHNIDVSNLQESHYSGLAIVDGKVTEEFQYKAPAPGSTYQPVQKQSQQKPDDNKNKSQPGNDELTEERIAQMSAEEVNKRWDEIETFLKAS